MHFKTDTGKAVAALFAVAALVACRGGGSSSRSPAPAPAPA